MSIRHGKVGLRSDGDYDYEEYFVVCDRCKRSYETHPPCLSFMAAVDSKKRLGFQSRKTEYGWKDICPDCIAKEAR